MMTEDVIMNSLGGLAEEIEDLECAFVIDFEQ